jgi:outer membrane protein assembly factor BamB
VPPVYTVGWEKLGIRATPTITDDYMYEVWTFGDWFCFERKTGKVIWEHCFRDESTYLDGTFKGNGNLEWKGFNGSLLPIGDKMQVFAYNASTGKVGWKFEEACPPDSRGPGLIAGSGLPIVSNKQVCVVIHGNRQWKILRIADGKQVWNWECSGPNEVPAWASGSLKRVGTNLYLDNLNGW